MIDVTAFERSDVVYNGHVNIRSVGVLGGEVYN